MARQLRKESSSGIYHVMMRGINHQTIFEDREDYYQFIATLGRMRFMYADDGSLNGRSCSFYAYCLMPNHFHLLIRECDMKISETIKRMANSYAYYYNRKYARDGHLFKDRYMSEPVNDMAYLTVLLRYIHQNPVKGGIVRNVKDYEYSSWGEYDGDVQPSFQVCDTDVILRRIPFADLNEWVNEPLPDDLNCLESDTEKPVLRMSDNQVWKTIIAMTSTSTISAFQKVEKTQQREVLRTLRQNGASIRQIERLTGVSRGKIQMITP